MRSGRITQLFVFDFDGSLVDTPDAEDGPVAYAQLTGAPTL